MRRHPAAFSLIELLLVIAIIGIMSAIAAPRYAGALVRYRADLAARRIVADLDMARNEAQSVSAPRLIVFDLQANRYQIAGISDLRAVSDAYTVKLSGPPYEATLTAVDFGGDGTVSFDGYGTPDSGGSVTFSVGTVTKVVVLDANTGKATVP